MKKYIKNGQNLLMIQYIRNIYNSKINVLCARLDNCKTLNNLSIKYSKN